MTSTIDSWSFVSYDGPVVRTRSLLRLIVLAVLLGAAVVPSTQAQSKRAGDTFYIKLGGGLSDYAGENSGRLALDDLTDFAEFFDTRKFTAGDKFPYMFSGEMGYQF